MGMLAGLAGALYIGQVGTADATTGSNVELSVIAAAVIGGASLAGGEGSVIGAAIGVLLLAVVEDAVILLNVAVFWQQLVVGVMLIVAVAVDVLMQKIRRGIGVRAALNRVVGSGTPIPAVPVAGLELEGAADLGSRSSAATER